MVLDWYQWKLTQQYRDLIKSIAESPEFQNMYKRADSLMAIMLERPETQAVRVKIMDEAEKIRKLRHFTEWLIVEIDSNDHVDLGDVRAKAQLVLDETLDINPG